MNRRQATGVAFGMTLACLVLWGCNGTSYAKVMRKKLEAVLGKSPLWSGTSYTWFPYPTNNFGVGTLFDLTADAPKANENSQLCATWSCIDVTVAPTDEKLIREFKGFADVGGGGSIALTEKEKKTASLSAVLPKVYQILNIEFGIEAAREVQTTLTLGQAWIRVLNKLAFERFIANLPANDRRLQAFAQGRLAFVAADVMVDSMVVTITVNEKIEPRLAAKLEGALAAGVIGKDTALTAKVTKAKEGTYTLTVNTPVIVAALVKTQRAGGVLAAVPVGSAGLDQWRDLPDVKLTQWRTE